jgi:Bacterial DNA polymerase III alpha subunit finger domain
LTGSVPAVVATLDDSARIACSRPLPSRLSVFGLRTQSYGCPGHSVQCKILSLSMHDCYRPHSTFLCKTLGVTLFQEQATRTVTVGAGFVPSKADCLRRAMTTLRVSPMRADASGIWKLTVRFQPEAFRIVRARYGGSVSRDISSQCCLQKPTSGERDPPFARHGAYATLSPIKRSSVT